MSKSVGQILKSIKENPEEWVPILKYSYCTSIECGKVKVSGYGNSRLLSVIDVSVNGCTIEIGFIDKWKLEVSLKKWFAECDMSHYQKCNNNDI